MKKTFNKKDRWNMSQELEEIVQRVEKDLIANKNLSKTFFSLAEAKNYLDSIKRVVKTGKNGISYS